MTATSHTKRRRAKWASMESLGFFESPSIASTQGRSSSVQSPVKDAPARSRQETTLVRTGRHVRLTGVAVDDMWNTTELDTPHLADWEPQLEISRSLGRRVRWSIVITVLVLLGGLAATGYWLYRMPDEHAASASRQLTADAGSLRQTIASVAPLVAAIAASQLPAANADSETYSALGDAARALFTSSSNLPAAETSAKDLAAQAASEVMEAQRELVGATTFRGVLEPALVPPTLETDSNLVDLTSAAAAFADWRAGYQQIVAALPTDVAPTAFQAAGDLGTRLESIQGAYVDAVRVGNSHEATSALNELTDGLETIRQAILSDMSHLAADIVARLDSADESLSELVG
jgi:hypothetical protein